MYHILTQEILIEGLKPIYRAISVRCSHSFEDLTQTATVILPRKVTISRNGELLAEKKIQDVIKKGLKIEIKLGYDGILKTEFVGYIARVQSGTPCIIHCEDDMFLLKQKKWKGNLEKTSLQQLLTAMMPGVKTQIPDNINIGNVRTASPESVANILKGLKDKFGFSIFFCNHELHCGFAYNEKDTISFTNSDAPKRITYNFGVNVVGSNLEYREKDDIKIKIRAVSINIKNEKHTVDVGDDDGDIRTIHFNDVSKEALPKIAKGHLDKFKIGGFSGTFQTWGIPFAQHGDIIQLEDDEYPEHNGAYYIKKVEVSFDENGFRRTIHPHQKAVPLTNQRRANKR